MSSNPQPYTLEDPTVVRLAKFLSRTPLSNGQLAPIQPPLSGLVAQAVCNFTAGLVWDASRSGWQPLGEWESDPEFGDLLVEQLTDAGITRMTHRTTGISVLGESPDDAWRQLRDKVRKVAADA